MSAAVPTQTQALLVELLTEELPPKALDRLGKAFSEGIRKILAQHHLLAEGCGAVDFATPRRLAVRFDAVLERAPDQSFTEKLMPARIGLDDSGAATPALTKKLTSKGLGHLSVGDLVTESDGKQDYLYARGMAAGKLLSEGLQEALDHAIGSLPIPKVMRYQLADGVTSVKFVRPAHRLVVLWGDTIVPARALGLTSGRRTLGHRFMSEGDIEITTAASYEQQLAAQGKVVASFDGRRGLIREQLLTRAADVGATIGEGAEVDALLDEVTALVEHPTVYAGQFDEQFLAVPQECLILTMRLNQKYFPLFEPDSGKLTHRFLIVSNMQVDDPSNIIEGNERVVRPRLADARFFFETDLKTPLPDRVVGLASSVYHNKLGSVFERVERVRRVSRHVAEQFGLNPARAGRAALLAKADLSSSMVGEFPELQGIMGAYYAAADGEPEDVVRAIRDQYLIRLDAPVTDATLTSTVLFIAERVETLVGIWGIGLAPTGERDPFGLRRAALGLISAYEQLRAGGYLKVSDSNTLALDTLLEAAAGTFKRGVIAGGTTQEIEAFIYERYRNQLAGEADRNVIDAVLALAPPLHQVQARIQACSAFAGRPEAVSLAAANKRIANLLKKAESAPGEVDAEHLQEPAERALADTIATLAPQARAQFEQGEFAASLATMAGARDAVDAFFKDVMVMAENPAVRANRLALLASLHRLMNQVADISRLAQ
ncbi:glycine--tRNA ligase subunit beta [Allopusillimonas soli]|uniref:Glycine--tRNA ligase beta subunit n=1 Tax=Allopusillimonas soli TaxID=659016 RepID=A0A853FCK1_9BURK|nr:glycine--tRNA ligase subunit beta [Allopusillimonas soli]NYT38525.1 glycine--tRNA ligase subunit beta [Allopusillimonas soli]TEA71754.1 glycine--tRNA ligase subunit beta [Allopusillimonas soli]